MVVACLIKQIQISCELQKMGDIGLLPRETIASIINSKFEDPVSTSAEDEDPLVKGEFDVIKELLEKLPGAVEGKKMVDRVIDICGPAPRGSGLQNLRECIIETKWKYDVAPEDRQGEYITDLQFFILTRNTSVAFKQMILNFMVRYFYLICFSVYASENGPDGFTRTFGEVSMAGT